MSEHPPIPAWAYVEACGAVGYDESAQMWPQLEAIIAAAAPVLWREWTRGMAVVPLPEREIAEAALEVRKYWRDWPQQKRDGVRILSRFVAGAIEDLCAAADRAEQLAAEQTEAVNGG